MTAETLKPFITPTSAVDDFPAKPACKATVQRRTRQLIPFVLGVIALALVVAILSLTIWQTSRVTHLDKELKSLKRVVDNLQQRLGINYLEEFDEFQKEYENALIDYPKKQDGYTDEDDRDDGLDLDADDEDGDDDDDGGEEGDTMDYFDEYEDMINKFRKQSAEDAEEETTSSTTAGTTEDSDNTSSASNDDNVFDDFTSYNASKKKKDRKSRSIAEVRNELQTIQGNHTEQEEKHSDEAASKESTLHHRRRLRHRTSRQRTLVRKGDSLISAKSVGNPDSRTPAAHFHLISKVPHRQAAIRSDSYQGDMYIGHANDGGDSSWQRHFSVSNGVLTVSQPGLYYVYAQICYNNSHDQNGFIVFRREHPFLQCLNTVPTNMAQKVHTCHTSGLIHLDEKDTIHLRDIHQDREAVLRNANNRSYFGIIKL